MSTSAEGTEVETEGEDLRALAIRRATLERHFHGGDHPLLAGARHAYIHTPWWMPSVRREYAARILELGGTIPRIRAARARSAWHGGGKTVATVLGVTLGALTVIIGIYALATASARDAGRDHAREVAALSGAVWQAERTWKARYGSYTDDLMKLKVGQPKPVYDAINDFDRKGDPSGDASIIVDADGDGFRMVVRARKVKEPYSGEFRGMTWRESETTARGCTTRYAPLPCTNGRFSLDRARDLLR